MSTVIVRLSSMADLKTRFAQAVRGARAGEAAEIVPAIEFADYDDMHKVLAPPRLAIVKALAGQGPLSIREVARRVGRDVQAVHRDVTTLINAGVIDRTSEGVSFPYDRIRFEYDVTIAA
jgi:predicted transcriptional regulator